MRDALAAAALLGRLRGMLGLRAEEGGRESSVLSLDMLERCTREVLVACGRAIGLVGLTRLPKPMLLERLGKALRDVGVLGDAEPRGGDTGLPPQAAHKFDLGIVTPAARPREHIPWSYGTDRVAAMVVDPDRLYVYWEVTDDAIAKARAGLGPGGRDAWLDLRIYDVTGRLFDGTNANGYVDQRVERTDRQWFFQVGRPTSSVCVEVGMRSREGYFVRMARSGRADFPRRDPSPVRDVEWLTVRTASGPVDGAAPGDSPADQHGGQRVLIRGIGPHEGRDVTWEIHRSWGTDGEAEIVTRRESEAGGYGTSEFVLVGGAS